MIDHVSIECADLGRAIGFYDAVLPTLGFARLVTREATAGYGKRYPEFWVNRREGGGSPATSGFHIALRCADTDTVQAFHAAALAAGGASDGAPGPRPASAEGYFAAFIKDPDGNRVEAATFVKEDGQ